MSSGDSVTAWIQQLRDGERDAARKLWDHYFHRLLALARQRFHGMPRAAADEEDVVLSVLGRLFRDAEGGWLPVLEDRRNLWQLLAAMTANKVADHLRREQSQKRGGGRAQQTNQQQLSQVLAGEPSPDVVAEVAEQWQRLLDRLGDEELRRIAILKMEGHSNEEIAAAIERVPRTVERRLQLIRAILSEACSSPEGA
jgi:DNA-directed RNA polymerase specialized sigma24 family protein